MDPHLPLIERTTAEAVAKTVGVAWDPWVQDWPLEVADAGRLGEFLSHYGREENSKHRIAIAALIVAALNSGVGGGWPRWLTCTFGDARLMKDRPVKTCDECGSLYFPETSRMGSLCPECSHLLYGYKACDHAFVDARCTKCYWDGTLSDYCKTLKRDGTN
jgi:hypothetical protein